MAVAVLVLNHQRVPRWVLCKSMHSFVCALLCLAMIVLVGAGGLTQPAAARDVANPSATITFGYLRMRYAPFDPEAILAGYLAAIDDANTGGYAPGVNFALDVTTVECTGSLDCRALTPVNQATIDDFIANKLPTYTAIMKPNSWISTAIIAAAKAAKIPVFDPTTSKPEDFAAGAEYLIHFNQYITTEIDHLFTFMQQDSGCARSGILHGTMDGIDHQVAHAQQLFVTGGMQQPPALDAGAFTDPELVQFFTEDPNRRCFLIIANLQTLNYIVGKLKTLVPAFNPAEQKFYGISMLASDRYVYGNDPTPYHGTHFVQWNPAGTVQTVDYSQHFQQGYTAYGNFATVAEKAYFAANAIPRMSSISFQSWLVMYYAMDLARSTFSRYVDARTHADSTTPGFTPTQFLDSAYTAGRNVDGYPFRAMVRKCPSDPYSQLCFCNTVTTTSFMFKPKKTSSVGTPEIVWDDASLGQSNIATVELDNKHCGYAKTTWSYPITNLLMLPVTFRVSATRGSTLEIMEGWRTIITDTFSAYVQATNFAPVAPARPLRLVPFEVTSQYTTQTALDAFSTSYNPFTIFGSMEGPLTTASVLTIFPSLLVQTLEDPVLVSFNEWNRETLSLLPTLSEYMHAMVNYYHTNVHKYTSVHVLVALPREAELLSMSFATFGYDIPVSAVEVVGVESAAWTRRVLNLLTDSSSRNPFVICTSARDQNFVLTAALAAAVTANRGTLAMVIPDGSFTNTVESTTIPADASVEVLFAGFRSEWWSPQARLDNVPAGAANHTLSLQFHYSSYAHRIAARLAELAQSAGADTPTAADILYQSMPTLTIGDMTFGPFSDTPCTEQQVKANTPDRRCQCKKGARIVHIHSVIDFQQRNAESRTNNFVWSMSKCGIVYKEYVPPPPAAKKMSTGTIAGIAVAGSLGLVCCIVAFVLVNYFCLGRNNYDAPKDNSLPFAVVFTDIQSSTALWARAPATMSEAVEEHHRLMRKILRRNNGYEVKTVGDSFMIAFRSAEDAVTFALEAQADFNDGDWNDEIDAIYVELLAETGLGGNGEDLREELAKMAGKSEGTTTSNAGGLHSRIGGVGGGVVIGTNGTTTFFDTDDDGSLSQQSAGKGYGGGGGVPHSFHGVNHNKYNNNRNANSNNNQHLRAANSFYNQTDGSVHSVSGESKTGGGGVRGGAVSNAGDIRMLSECASDDEGAIVVVANNNAAHHHGNTNTNNNNNPHVTNATNLHHVVSAGSPFGTNNNNNTTVGNLTTTSTTNMAFTPSATSASNFHRTTSAHNHGGVSGIGGGGESSAAFTNVSYTATTTQQQYGCGGGGAPSIMVYPRSMEEGTVASQRRGFGNNSNANNNGLQVVLVGTEAGGHTAAGDLSTLITDGSSYNVRQARNQWHGLRVRIGVHYGMGDIRKDPVSQGYDYYGTVVNTAARVEGVGHGGQTLVTQEAFAALDEAFVRKHKAVVIALGAQPLRGLDAPVVLYQFVPACLAMRRFPPLRLHIEKESDETDANESNTHTASSEAEPPEAVAARICASKQFQKVSIDDVLLHYYYFLACFGPTNDKCTNGRTRLLVGVIAKITKTCLAARKAGKVGGVGGGVGRRSVHNTGVAGATTDYSDSNYQGYGGGSQADGSVGGLHLGANAASAKGGDLMWKF